MSLKDSDILNLPEAPDFMSEETDLTLNELIALCEKMLPYTNEIRYSKPEPEFLGEAFSLVDKPDSPNKA